jgi:nucleoid DNA-binding protein
VAFSLPQPPWTRSGAAIKIEAARVSKFRAGKALKDGIN